MIAKMALFLVVSEIHARILCDIRRRGGTRVEAFFGAFLALPIPLAIAFLVVLAWEKWL